jgi:excisionase family DNA binding protein
MDKRVFNLKEAAIYLGKTEKALYRAVERRQVPFRKWGRKYIFDRIELDKFIVGLPGITFDDVAGNKYSHLG